MGEQSIQVTSEIEIVCVAGKVLKYLSNQSG